MTKQIIREDKDSKIIVVTPLYEGDKISAETRKTIKRNDIPFTWISSEGKSNIPKNAFAGLDWYLKKKGTLPEYYIMIDRDITLGRNMLDRLHQKLSKAPVDIAYSYASFKFTGFIKRDFPAVQWDINKLLLSNYISSNSLFRTTVIYEVGLVFDDQYKRLLDWAFLLKLFQHGGYYGIPCPEASFEAVSNPKSVSAGSTKDYEEKRKLIFRDFCKPLLDAHIKTKANRQDEMEPPTFQLKFGL